MIIGANAVVTKDVPDNSVVAGMPARVIESVEEYYEKHYKSYVPTFSMSKEQKREYLMKYKPELFENN